MATTKNGTRAKPSKARLAGSAGLTDEVRAKAIEVLTDRLYSLLDLHLTLKQIHWNVVGPSFIGVHEMLDVHTEFARRASDELAERIVTLGGEAWGTPARIVGGRRWDDYPLGKGVVADHLSELTRVYDDIIVDTRAGMDSLEEEPVSQDMLTGFTEKLEQYRWMTAAHLESDGTLAPGISHTDPARKSTKKR